MQYRLESACLIKPIYKSNELNENSFATTLFLKDYNWCNIDRFIQSESSINFEVKTKNLHLNRSNTYLVNDETHHVIYKTNYDDKIEFKTIPFLENTNLHNTTKIDKTTQIYLINSRKDNKPTE